MGTSFPPVTYLTHRIPAYLSTSAGRIPGRPEWSLQSMSQTSFLWCQWRRSIWTSYWVECDWTGHGWDAPHNRWVVSCRQWLLRWSTDSAAGQCRIGQCWLRQRETFPALWSQRPWCNWGQRGSQWSCSVPVHTPVWGRLEWKVWVCAEWSILCWTDGVKVSNTAVYIDCQTYLADNQQDDRFSNDEEKRC